MQWLRIMSHRREEKIVCFGDGATDGMGDGVANSPLVEISAAHDAASRTTRARSIPSVTCAPSTTFRSEEHTSELQSLMRISYAVFCLKKKINKKYTTIN